MHSDLQQLEQELPPRQRTWLHAARYAGWTLVGLYFLFALVVLAIRFLVLPGVASYGDTIAAAASRALGEKVTIGRIEADWSALHPRLQLADVAIHDHDGREALRLPHVDVTIAWRSLLYGRPILRSLVLDAPDLQIRRSRSGELYVAGLEIRHSAEDGPGLADAVFDMKRLLIRDASLQWDDELRGAPPLKLASVNVLVENSGRNHRFALSADPPREYAAPLDVRGVLVGRSLKTLEAWDGRVFVASEYVDLAVWSAWIDYPFEIASGRGAVRVWATLRDWQPQDITADVSLADVAARIASDLPRLELKWVEGRVGARAVTQGFEFIDLGGERQVSYEAFGRRLGLETSSGETFERADFQAQWQPRYGKQAEQGRASATSLDVAPLAVLGESLPFPQKIRALLAGAAPRGRLEEVAYAWTGDVENPATFSGRARFRDLGIREHEKLPGVAKLSGGIEATERGGTLVLQSPHATFEHSRYLPDGPIEFDTLTGQVAWTHGNGGVDVRIESLNLANAELAGSVSGSLQRRPDGATEADISARIPRADGAKVYRYIPDLEPHAAAWVKAGIVSAQVTDGRIRVKGDLRDFPFEDPKKGVFESQARITNGVLEFAEGWPRLTGVTADFSVGAGKLQVVASRGAISGVQVPRVVAVIPDVFHKQSHLRVEGDAEGATADFLRFVAESPVDRLTEGAFRGWTADGRGRLALGIEAALADIERMRVSGRFQVAGNTLRPGLGEIALNQVSGRVDFTDTSVTAKGLTAQWLGGPLAIDVSSSAGAVQVAGQGTVSVPAAMKALSLPFAQRTAGTAPYRFSLNVKGHQHTLVVDSSLAGAAIDLPPPFDKPAGESWPLRLERTGDAGAIQSIDVSLGKVLNARGLIRVEGARWSIDRAGVGVGDLSVPVPERPGVFVSVNLKRLDLDRFIALQGSAADPSSPAFDIGALSIRAGELVVGGRLFHDVSVRALQVQATRWQATVAAKELAGDIAYGSDGKGAVVAKLKRLMVPESIPDAPGARPPNALESLPAIELVAESYLYRDRDLGRLEVRAVNERRGWRVEHASLSSADCTFDGKGLWQPRTDAAPASTEFDFSIAVSSIGGCLDRFGQPDTVKGGVAMLQGRATWAGPPYAIDYPTLSGKVALTADKGQFVKVRPGIGRLLGVLSLQSLPRRVTLDFRDVFSEGFAFDTIRGTAAIDGGIMRTTDFAMIGPAANVTMTGSVNLAQETQDLTVRVVPVIGDSVAAAAGVALLNPIIGAGALLAQRILKDPIGQMFAFQYHVTGGWEEPRVEKINPAVATRKPGENQ